MAQTVTSFVRQSDYGKKLGNFFTVVMGLVFEHVIPLISRAVCSSELTMPHEYYGSVFFNNLISFDRTNEYLDAIESQFEYNINTKNKKRTCEITGAAEVEKISDEYNIGEHFIKPGISEAIRAFLRKEPDIILASNLNDEDVQYLLNSSKKQHSIEFRQYPLKNYKMCSLYQDRNTDIL